MDTLSSSSSGKSWDFTARFRAKPGGRQPLHPLEIALLVVVATHLAFLPWAFGGMREWSQWTSLGFSLVAFVLALLPRSHEAQQRGEACFRVYTWRKLIRFPIFWLGLALLTLVTVQGLNPAWEYKTDGKFFWMQAIPYKHWLPSGVRVPFAEWGPWRMLLIYSAPWLTICAIWIGFTRRRSLQFLFTVLSANGLLLALFGIAERILGNGKIYWTSTSSNPSFFSSFIYKNHAGAYLDLVLAVTCGLAAWHYFRGLRRFEKSNPCGVFTFFAMCIAVSIVTSNARGATLVMLAFLCTTTTVLLIHQLQSRSDHRKPIVAIILILIFGYFVKVGLETSYSREAWTRLRHGIMREDTSLEVRERATYAAREMLGDYWKTGAGSGSFKFIFPIYQHRNPDLAAAGYWEHAHNDLLEIPIELGASGMLLLLGFLAWLTLKLVRTYFWRNPVSSCLAYGVLLILAYAKWDFPFQNPAILLTWCITLVTAAMWAQLEKPRVKE